MERERGREGGRKKELAVSAERAQSERNNTSASLGREREGKREAQQRPSMDASIAL